MEFSSRLGLAACQPLPAVCTYALMYPAGMGAADSLLLYSFLFSYLYHLHAILLKEERLRIPFHCIKIREFRNFDIKPANNLRKR